jgi:hypothetical protein
VVLTVEPSKEPELLEYVVFVVLVDSAEVLKGIPE